MKIDLVVLIVVTLMVLLVYSVPCVAQLEVKSEVFDGRYEGLILGGGVGYSIVSSDVSDLTSGLTAQGKIGFGTSDRFSLYFSTLIPSITPGLGFNYFPKADSRLYYHGLLGYKRADSDSNFLIAGGTGYEFHKYLSLEFTIGLNRYSEVDDDANGADETTDNSYILTVGGTFNFAIY